jgi:hypothetical protein
MKNRDFLFLILAAIFSFAVVSFALQLPANAFFTNQFVNADPISYWDAAKLIYEEGGKPHPIRPFFYPFLIGLPSLFSASQSAALVWALSLNFLFWLSTVALIFKVLNDNTSRKIALIGAAIFVSNTSNIILVWTALAESLFHFLIIASVYFLSKYLKNEEKKANFITFVTFFCLSCITRPTHFPLFFILIPLLIWSVFKRYLSLITATISLIIFVSTVGFNTLKVKQTYGKWTLSYLGDCALYAYLGGFAKGAKPEKTWRKMRDDWGEEVQIRNTKTARHVDSIPWSALAPLVENDLKEQFQNNKTGLILALGYTLFTNSTGSDIHVLYFTNFKNQPYFFKVFLKPVFNWSRLQNTFNSFAQLCIIPLLFYRQKKYFWQKNKPVFWLLLFNSFLGISTILISSITFTQGDRFHLVTMPLTLVSLGIFYHYKNDYKSLIVKELDPSV